MIRCPHCGEALYRYHRTAQGERAAGWNDLTVCSICGCAWRFVLGEGWTDVSRCSLALVEVS